MMVSVLLYYHQQVHIFTRDTAVMEFDHSRVYTHKLGKPFAESRWYLRLPGQFIYQLKYCLGLLRSRNDLDLVIFGGSGLIFPIVFSRLLGIFTLYRVGGVITRNEQAREGSTSMIKQLWVGFLHSVQEMIYSLSQVIIVISPKLTDFAQINEYEDKIHVWNHYFFDLELFSARTEFDSRKSVVGQVGIISGIKGSMNFMESIALLDDDDIPLNRVLVVGDGPLKSDAIGRASRFDTPVDFTGRVERHRVSDYMNEMKLLVISSVSEGMPKVALESMACGTPVIATDVGGIPDYIKHGENGFLIPDNKPETISQTIADALGSDELDRMSSQAREYVEANFSYEGTVEQYGRLLDEGCPHQFPTPTQSIENPLDS
jgi:glycosyltransferase involved in cell wall biosynthesis